MDEGPINTPPDAIMQYFSFAHLPRGLQVVSRPFFHAAYTIHATLPKCAERAVALRKLLESKDAAVRAALNKPQFGNAELELMYQSSKQDLPSEPLPPTP